jgi:dolichol-phosphate mannosyltransferase
MIIVVIIPTYNEKENIGLLIQTLEQQFHGIHHDMRILVVDDNSPDGTANVVRSKMREYDNIHLLTGKKEGLGAAYIRGITYAVAELKADVVFEMDGDFSHKPEDIPCMIAALEQGADVIIGSRYVTGGSISKDWGLMRKLISRMGNMVARYVAGLYTIRDCTAGFRAIRSNVLANIELSDLNVQGYAFQVALLHQAIVSGAKVKEIPVEFIDRTRGRSKLGLSDIIEFIINAWWIRFQSSKTFIKFAMVGASGAVTNLGAFTLLLKLGTAKYIASPIAIELSIIWNFLLNNFWTFRDRANNGRTVDKGLRFNVVSVIALGVSYSTFLILSKSFPGELPHVHQAVSIIPATFVNYFLNSYWTFQESEVQPGTEG